MTASNVSANEALLGQLKAILGSDAEQGSAWSETDVGRFSVDGVTPDIVLSPSSAEQIAAILRLANEHDAVVVPAGGMTRQGIGNLPERVDILLRSNLVTKMQYDPTGSTLSAGAGVTIAELENALAGTSHFLPLDPMLSGRTTVGGVLATNAHGPLVSGYGNLRELCIGLDFVTAEGTTVRDARQLHGLLIGSFGTLGVITNAKFKLHSKPARMETLVSEFGAVEEAIRFRDQVMGAGATPMCMEIASPRAQEYLQEAKPPRDPDVYAPSAPVRVVPWKVFVRFGGEDAEIEGGRKAGGGFIQNGVSGPAEEVLWRRFADWEEAVVTRHRNATIFHVATKIADIAVALKAGEQTGIEHNLLFAGIGRIAAGALVVAFLPMGVDPVSAMQVALVASAFRGRLPEDASAVVVQCPREAKGYFNVWGSTPTDLQLMRTVRRTFDPKGILNRGRFMV